MSNLRIHIIFLIILAGWMPPRSAIGQRMSLDKFVERVEENLSIKVFYDRQSLENVRVGRPDKEVTSDTLAYLNQALEDSGLGALRYDSRNWIVGRRVELSQVISLDYVLVKERFTKADLDFEEDLLVLGDSSMLGMQKNAMINLRVSDGETEERLSGAVLYIEELSKSVESDVNGIIRARLPTGVYLAEIRQLSYDPFIVRLAIISDGIREVSLIRETIQLEEVIITEDGTQSNVLSPLAGVVTITPRKIKELPVFLGEPDLIQTLITIPGVSSLGEGAPGYYVRGGNIDQNLVLQDNSIFFNSNHALGFFSVFNPDLIGRVTFYKGHIPAYFGGRLSSVLDVGLKKSVSETKITGGIGTVMSKLSAELPFKEGRGSLLIGGRISYSDWILKVVKIPSLRESSASFHDLNVILNQRIGKKGSQFTVSVYESGDRVQFADEFGFEWRIRNMAASFSLPIGEKLVSESHFSFGDQINENFDPSQQQDFILSNGQSYFRAQQDFSTSYERHGIRVGAELIQYRPKDELLTNLFGIEQEAVSRPRGYEYGAYVNDEWLVSDMISFSVGVRLAGFTIDPTVTQSGESFLNWEPRLSLRVATSVTSSVKVSYNRMNQYLQLISNTAAALPNDLWLLSSSRLEPQRANNFSLGFFRNFEFDRWESSMEVYYRDLINITESRSFADLILNPDLEDELVQGDGRAYGIEFSLKRDFGDVKGNFSYTYSRSELLVALNEGQSASWIPASIDRPHSLNLNMDFRVSRKASFAMNFVFNSGRPVTAPVSTYLLGRVLVPHFSERNTFRIPDYHRLDIAYTIKRNAIRKRWYQDSITFSIYNLYSRRNAFSVFFRKDDGSPASAYRLAVLGSAFPSISYNFEF